MKIGDQVRVTKIPESMKQHWLEGRRIFKRCVGRTFPIRGFQSVLKRHENWLELWVGEVLGRRPETETIWIEPSCVKRVASAPKRKRRK